MNEEALVFGKEKSLVGIVTYPNKAGRETKLPAVILANAGMVHRVGPHRIHVKMARRLALQGFLVLRFDFSGIGDSGPRFDNLPAQQSRIAELQDAMDELYKLKGAEEFILAGICSGAIASYQAGCVDPRVVGLVQINPPGYSNLQVSHAKWQRLLKELFSDPKTPLKKVTESSRYLRRAGHLSRVFTGKWKTGQEARRMRERFLAMNRRGIKLLFVYRVGDLGLHTLKSILGTQNESLVGDLQVHIVQKTDHIFTPLRSQEELLVLVSQWLQWTSDRHSGTSGDLQPIEAPAV